jgi:stalled ribosome rescue protein Dom34
MEKEIESNKCLGIWMDHSVANLIDLSAGLNKHSISSDFTFETKEEALSRSEFTMHNKQEQMQTAYYKKISDEIVKYNHVLLFGPTNAKTELHNYLNKDLHFKDIQIDIESGDKMTEKQQFAFVKKYFPN